MARSLHAAVDLGAGSGRVVLGGPQTGGMRFEEIHRFHYHPRRSAGHLRWNISQLLDGIRTGLRLAAGAIPAGDALASAGVDSWGVDYALLDAEGGLLEEPVCYRDERTAGIIERVTRVVSREEIYRATGIQFLALNTLFQLVAHCAEGLPAGASRVLMIPDFCHHHLCGSTAGELTNASTTQLLNLATADWDRDLFERLRLPLDLMPALAPPGTVLGDLDAGFCGARALARTRVIQPATHDTASAVAGTPLRPGWAYISSGTWSLVGVERPAPIATEAALALGVTNERGVEGRVRLLRNVMGLWIVESCWREWRAEGRCGDLPELVARAAALRGTPGLIYPDHPRFFNPPGMAHAVREALAETGQPVSDDPAVLTRIALDSLALRYASIVGDLEGLTGSAIEGVHIVGGGALNGYLNQATADATGRPVLAGPAEATALGNLAVQAMASGTLGSLEAGRRAIARSFPPASYAPRADTRWREATRRYREIEAVTPSRSS